EPRRTPATHRRLAARRSPRRDRHPTRRRPPSPSPRVGRLRPHRPRPHLPRPETRRTTGQSNRHQWETSMNDLTIYRELEQRSPEWLAARAGLVTASVVGRLITDGKPDPA